MKKFKYIAKDLTGKEVTGTLEAKSLDAVADFLNGKDLTIVSLKEDLGLNLEKLNQINVGGVPITDKVLFMRQFSTMISAGISLNKALEILTQQVSNPLFKKVIKNVLADVEGGSSLSKAFRKEKGIFDDVTLGLIDAAEATGNLEEVLKNLADDIEASKRLKDKIKSAFLYPVIIVVIMILVVIMLIVLLVPVMDQIYGDFDSELPAVTMLLIHLSNFLKGYWWLLLVAVSIMVAGFKMYIDTAGGKRVFHMFILKMPIFGKLMTKIQLAQFTRTLSLLLKSGLSIISALEITSTSLSNVHYKNALLEAKSEVEKGTPLAIPISRNNLFPIIVSQMIAVGEESGDLDNILKKMSEFFNDEVTVMAGNLATLLEPVILVVMGGLIGFIAAAVYMPMFQLAETMF
jgi:type IV pilus assembly protein PilC